MHARSKSPAASTATTALTAAVAKGISPKPVARASRPTVDAATLAAVVEAGKVVKSVPRKSLAPVVPAATADVPVEEKNPSVEPPVVESIEGAGADDTIENLPGDDNFRSEVDALEPTDAVTTVFTAAATVDPEYLSEELKENEEEHIVKAAEPAALVENIADSTAEEEAVVISDVDAHLDSMFEMRPLDDEEEEDGVVENGVEVESVPVSAKAEAEELAAVLAAPIPAESATAAAEPEASPGKKVRGEAFERLMKRLNLNKEAHNGEATPSSDKDQEKELSSRASPEVPASVAVVAATTDCQPSAKESDPNHLADLVVDVEVDDVPSGPSTASTASPTKTIEAFFATPAPTSPTAATTTDTAAAVAAPSIATTTTPTNAHSPLKRVQSTRVSELMSKFGGSRKDLLVPAPVPAPRRGSVVAIGGIGTKKAVFEKSDATADAVEAGKKSPLGSKSPHGSSNNLRSISPKQSKVEPSKSPKAVEKNSLKSTFSFSNGSGAANRAVSPMNKLASAQSNAHSVVETAGAAESVVPAVTNEEKVAAAADVTDCGETGITVVDTLMAATEPAAPEIIPVVVSVADEVVANGPDLSDGPDESASDEIVIAATPPYEAEEPVNVQTFSAQSSGGLPVPPAIQIPAPATALPPPSYEESALDTAVEPVVAGDPPLSPVRAERSIDADSAAHHTPKSIFSANEVSASAASPSDGPLHTTSSSTAEVSRTPTGFVRMVKLASPEASVVTPTAAASAAAALQQSRSLGSEDSFEWGTNWVLSTDENGVVSRSATVDAESPRGSFRSGRSDHSLTVSRSDENMLSNTSMYQLETVREDLEADDSPAGSAKHSPVPELADTASVLAEAPAEESGEVHRSEQTGTDFMAAVSSPSSPVDIDVQFSADAPLNGHDIHIDAQSAEETHSGRPLPLAEEPSPAYSDMSSSAPVTPLRETIPVPVQSTGMGSTSQEGGDFGDEVNDGDFDFETNSVADSTATTSTKAKKGRRPTLKGLWRRISSAKKQEI
jgi:WAS/WASL-interacting protein